MQRQRFVAVLSGGKNWKGQSKQISDDTFQLVRICNADTYYEEKGRTVCTSG